MQIPNFSKRLDTILRQRGMKQKELAELAGMSDRHLSVTKNSGEIPESFLRKILGALHISQEEFFKDASDISGDYFPVPFREASGGMGEEARVGSKKVISYISLRRDFLRTKTVHLEALSFINAFGESMSPTIPPDAIVLIDESQTEPVNGKIFYIMLNGVFLIKRLEVRNSIVTAIISDNGHRREEIGEQDNFQILGKAILQQTLL